MRTLYLVTTLVFGCTSIAFGEPVRRITFGGTGGDVPTAIAVDAAGNTYIAGETDSADLPVTPGVFKDTYVGGMCGGGFRNPPYPCPDYFVAKIDRDYRLSYLTYLGISNQPYGIGVDATGSVLISGSLFAKLSPAADRLVYSRPGVPGLPAMDAAGNLFLVSSVELPSPPVPAIHRSIDGGQTWQTPPAAGGPANFGQLVVDQAATSEAATALVGVGYQDIYRSLDSGQTWTPIPNVPIPTFGTVSQGVVVAAGRIFFGNYRTADLGAHWSPMRCGIPSLPGSPDLQADISGVAAHPETPSVLYGQTYYGLCRSTDGGETWTRTALLNDIFATGPKLLGVWLLRDAVLARDKDGLLRSTDGGASWSRVPWEPSLPPSISMMVPDPRNPRIAYAAVADPAVLITEDAGATWRRSPDLTRNRVNALAFDGSRPGRIYGAIDGRLLVSDDAGVTFRPLEGLADQPMSDFAVDTRSGRVFVALGPRGGQRNIVIQKVNPETGQVAWRRVVGGEGIDNPGSIALDRTGTNLYVAGYTSSRYFPVTPGALQRELAGPDDGFVLQLSAASGEVRYATYLGSRRTDAVGSISPDDRGGLFVAGGTEVGGPPFPEPSIPGAQARSFVVRLTPGLGGIDFATYLAGSPGSFIQTDPAGGVVVVGQRADQVFAARINAKGDAYSYFRNLDPDDYRPRGLAVDGDGVAHIIAYTRTRGADVSLTRIDPRPEIAADGIRNGASLATDGGVASPGAMVSVFGSGLASRRATAPGGPPPLTLGGTTVRLDGVAIPVTYVSPEQINAVIPWETKTGSALTLEVSNDEFPASPTRSKVMISAVSPGIFDVRHGDDLAAVTAERPVAAGEMIAIFATGLGQVNAEGATVNRPEVEIGRVRAEVTSSALVPGQNGVYRIDARVPEGIVGQRVEMAIAIEGAVSAPRWIQTGTN